MSAVRTGEVSFIAPFRYVSILLALVFGITVFGDKENSWVKVSSLKNDEHVIVRIEDNGLGIPEHLQPNIFDMFFRAHADSSGSGLGLYISMESIAKLSGNITLQSVEGKGSMFDVAIPIAVE